MKKFKDVQIILLLFTAIVLVLSAISGTMPFIYQETRWNIDWQNVPEDTRTNYARIRCMTIADNGDLWAGSDNGVIHISGQTWETYASRRLHHIRDIDVAPDGQVWVLTQGNEVLTFDGQSWQHMPTLRAPEDIAITPDGILWGADYQGLLQFDGEQWQLSGLIPTGPDKKEVLVTMDVAPDGSLWVGGHTTDVDLFHIKNNQVVLTDTININGGNIKIKTSALNQIWIYSMGYKATTTDFGYYENGKWFELLITDRPWLGIDFPYDFAPTDQGVTWIATQEGLCRFNGVFCINYLKGESIYTVETAPDGSIWLGLESEIVKLSRA